MNPIIHRERLVASWRGTGGDFFNIPEHKKHRVEWSTPESR